MDEALKEEDSGDDSDRDYKEDPVDDPEEDPVVDLEENPVEASLTIGREVTQELEWATS